MNDYTTQLLEVARARLANRPDLSQRFQVELSLNPTVEMVLLTMPAVGAACGLLLDEESRIRAMVEAIDRWAQRQPVPQYLRVEPLPSRIQANPVVPAMALSTHPSATPPTAPNNVPAGAGAAPAEQQTALQRRAMRWQACIEAGLEIDTNTYATLPRGIGRVAKQLGITRQTLGADLRKYREHLATRQA